MSLEGGNTYPNAILRQQDRENREEQNFIDSSLVEAREHAAISEQTEKGIAELGESMERERQVQEILDVFEESLEGTNIELFNVFKNFILRTNDTSIQNSFINEFDSMKIWEVVDRSGRFPVNEFEFQQSLIEGTILEEIQEGHEEIRNNFERAKRSQVKLQDFRESLSGIQLGDTYLISLLERIGNISLENIDDTKADEIVELEQQLVQTFKNSREIEQTILPQALAQGPEVFERVSRNLVGLDSNFRVRIDAWRLTPDFQKLPAEQMMRVSGALGVRADDVKNEARQSGNIFSLDLPGGAIVEYDIMRDRRTLSTDGYRLASQVPDVGDYQTPKLAYMRVEQAHLPQLQKIVAAGETLDQAGLESDDISQIQDILKNTLGYSYFVELGMSTLSITLK